MFRKSVIFFCVFYFVLISRKSNAAITEEQKGMIHEHFKMLESICSKEYPIADADLENLKAKQLGTGPNVPCFLSCIFKQIGVINDEGMMEKESVLNLAKKVFTTDEQIQLISDYLHSCLKINEKPVTDGNKGCERSTMAFECLTENAAKYEFEF